MQKIVIIGDTHHNTLSMVRCIGKKHGKVDLILHGTSDSYVSKSKYIGRIYYIDSYESLVKLFGRGNDDYKDFIVICCSDAAMQTIDKNLNALRKDVKFFTCGAQGGITDLMDKTRQVEIAQRYGLYIPESLTVSDYSQIPGEFNIFPCLIKPAQSYEGGKKVVVCHNLGDLKESFSQFPDNVELQIQQLIKKSFEIVLPGISVNGEVKIPAVVLKHRDSSGATTYSSVIVPDDLISPVIKKCEELIKGIGYEGLFGFEFIFDGLKYYFIELNLRNDATCYSVAKAGCDLPNYYIDRVSGEKASIESLAVDKSMNSMVEFNDFSFVLRRVLSPVRWIKELKHSECLFYYDRDDKKAFFAAMEYWLKQWSVKKIIK